MDTSLSPQATKDRTMLVLSRKAGQRIQIGDNVFVTVTGITGKRIRLGIEAPAEVAIRRSEVPPPPTTCTVEAVKAGESAGKVA
jgi:carbon storage regulator